MIEVKDDLSKGFLYDDLTRGWSTVHGRVKSEVLT